MRMWTEYQTCKCKAYLRWSRFSLLLFYSRKLQIFAEHLNLLIASGWGFDKWECFNYWKKEVLHSIIYLLPIFKVIEPEHNKTNEMSWVWSEDLDQSGHLPSLISLHCVLYGLLRSQILFWQTAKTGENGHSVWCKGWSVFTGGPGHFTGYHAQPHTERGVTQSHTSSSWIKCSWQLALAACRNWTTLKFSYLFTKAGLILDNKLGESLTCPYLELMEKI